MSQFLFVVEVPPIPQGTAGMTVSPAWQQFSSAADTTIKSLKSVVPLQPNAWLLTTDKTLPLLAELAALASKHSLSYSSLLLPVDAVIIAHDVKPKT